MKGDRELCMAAVAQAGQQDEKALQWASEEMKGDRELCMAAVAQNWRALGFVSQEMKDDLGFLKAFVHGQRQIHGDGDFIWHRLTESGVSRELANQACQR